MNLSGIRAWKSLNWPNRISLVRLLLIAPFFIFVLNQNDPDWQAGRYDPGWSRHMALAIFVVMALSDALDGYLARRLNARTRLGAILDPLADKSMIISSVVLLSMPNSAVPAAVIPNWVVVLVVGKELWVILGFLVVYLVTDRFRVRPTIVGKLCTAVQCLMLGFTLLAPELNRLAGGLGTEIAKAMTWATAAASLAAIASYTRLGLIFVAREGKPLEEQAAGKNHEPH